MKTSPLSVALAGLFACLSLPPNGQSRESVSPLRYKFPGGQTNVYRVEYSVSGENGTETNFGTLFLVPLPADPGVLRLSCRATLETKRSPGRPPFGYYGGYGGPSGPGVRLPEGCEIQVDDQGHVLRVSGDYPLPAPLGELMQSLIPPLPATLKSSWETEGPVSVMDDPLWLGPGNAFFSAQNYGPPFFMNYGPRSPLAVINATQHLQWRLADKTPETVTLHQQLSLVSLLQAGGEPRLAARGGGDLVFDRAAGLFQKIDLEFDTATQTENSTRKAKVRIAYRQLQGAELEAVLNPPPAPAPPAPHPLTGAEVAQLINELESDSPDTRRTAAGRLRDITLEAPSPKLLNLAMGFLTNPDASLRQSAAPFVCRYAAGEQVPALLKLLKDPDWGLRQNTLKAIARLKDERAIAPLVDLIARGGQMNQPSQEINACLAGFGPAAESAVLELLRERNAETRRQACGLLQQIGTDKSLESLQKLVGDPDPALSQAAVEALRALQARQ